MDDLEFATDRLYAAGWWPRDGEECVQSPDGRWIPSEQSILESLRSSRVRFNLVESSQNQLVDIKWKPQKGADVCVHARSRHEALLFAYSSCFTVKDQQS